MATLIFFIDDGREIAVPVDGRVTVGSVEGNDVMVEDAGVSARHAEIAPTPVGGYHLRDLGSETGTKVNGERVASRNLQHGDEVSFGRLHGRFFIHEAGDALPPEEQAKNKLRELKGAYNETFANHTTLLDVVTSLSNQERQKLASLNRLQTDTLNLETRIANARGILHHLEESIAKASEAINRTAPEQQKTSEDAEKLNTHSEQLKTSVAKLENEKLELERTLWELAERRKESEARRDQADAETSRTRAEHQNLSAEISVLTQKQSEFRTSLHEQETRIVSLTRSLEETSLSLLAETEKIGRLTHERQRLEQDIAALKAEEARARETIVLLENQHFGITAALRESEVNISRADAAHAELLERHRQSQTEIETLRADKEHHDIEISRLGIELRNLQSSIVDMETRQSAGLELVRLRQDQVRSANEKLDETKAQHEAEIHSRTQTLNTMLERLHAAEAHLQESTARNEVLTLQNHKLEEVLAQIQNADEKHNYLAGQNHLLEEQATRLNSNIDLRHGEMESVTEQLTRLRVDESAMMKIIQTLQDNAHTEQQRFDQSLKTYAEIDQQAAARHGELESTLENLRGQINKLEAHLTSLEVWKDDMDEHYARLATMPEDSPEALKLWREIHRQKGNITAMLPAQTGIKPRFNTQVHVVPRGQRPG